jgi:hypothetical protein
MGKIRSGILGAVSGRVGNVVGGSWNGVSYLRSLPAVVRQTNSVAQTAQRERFALMGSFLRPLSGLLKIGFRAEASGMTAYNAAFAWNFRNALTEVDGQSTIDFSKALLSKGNLPGAVQAIAELTESGEIRMQWANNAGESNAAGSDYLYYALVEPETLESVFRLNAGTREAGSLSIVPPVQFAGKSLEVYLGFFSVDSLVSSVPKNGIANSVYAGEIILP